MKSALEKLFQDQFCFWSLAFSLIALSLGIFLIGFSWSRLPPEVPLYFSRPWGQEQLAPKFQIIILPALSLGIFLSHLVTATRLFTSNLPLVRILIGTSSVLILVLILSLFQIINLIA